MSTRKLDPSLLAGDLLGRAARDAVGKLNPASLIRNPVIFVTEIVAAAVTVLGAAQPRDRRARRASPWPSPPGSG